MGSFDKGRDQNKLVTIPIYLSPCKSYSRIEISSKFRGNKGERKDYAKWQARAFGNCCRELTSKAPTSTTATTLQDEDFTSPTTGNNTTPVREGQTNTAVIGIVVGVVLIALIALALVTIILLKRKSEKREKRGDVTKTEENNLYRIYGDGPLYNVVTDENDYYGS